MKTFFTVYFIISVLFTNLLHAKAGFERFRKDYDTNKYTRHLSGVMLSQRLSAEEFQKLVNNGPDQYKTRKMKKIYHKFNVSRSTSSDDDNTHPAGIMVKHHHQCSICNQSFSANRQHTHHRNVKKGKKFLPNDNAIKTSKKNNK